MRHRLKKSNTITLFHNMQFTSIDETRDKIAKIPGESLKKKQQQRTLVIS